MMAIVVSEDEKVRKKIERMLENMEVEHCDNFLGGVSKVLEKQKECGIVLVDFDMSPFNGVGLLELVREINRNIQTVLMIRSGDEEAEVEGLSSKVDLIIEYDKSIKVNKVYVERLIEERKERILTYINGSELIVNGKRVVLTRKEVEIVRILIEKEGEAVGREEIVERIWKEKGGIRRVDLHIKMIRKKMKREGFPDCIVTVSGEGYRWVYDERGD